MNNVSIIAQQLLQQPVEVENTLSFTSVQKVAGLFLVSFFLFLGISIIFGGLKAEEYGIYYLLFGLLLCSFPFFVILIIKNSKNKSITLLDKNGVLLKNNKMYNWENLRGITYHSSLYAQKNRYVSVEFKFTNGNAFAPAGSNAFSYILYIVERLPVPKQEIAVTRFN